MSKFFIQGKVIVISGSPHETAIQTEILDLWDQDYSLIGQNYSIAVDGSVGIFAQSKILNCGGAYPFISDCFILDQNGFQSYASLLEPRGYAASIMVNGIFWITGGGNPGFSNSSEILDLSKAKSDLVQDYLSHCSSIALWSTMRIRLCLLEAMTDEIKLMILLFMISSLKNGNPDRYSKSKEIVMLV